MCYITFNYCLIVFLVNCSGFCPDTQHFKEITCSASEIRNISPHKLWTRVTVKLWNDTVDRSSSVTSERLEPNESNVIHHLCFMLSPCMFLFGKKKPELLGLKKKEVRYSLFMKLHLPFAK